MLYRTNVRNQLKLVDKGLRDVHVRHNSLKTQGLLKSLSQKSAISGNLFKIPIKKEAASNEKSENATITGTSATHSLNSSNSESGFSNRSSNSVRDAVRPAHFDRLIRSNSPRNEPTQFERTSWSAFNKSNVSTRSGRTGLFSSRDTTSENAERSNNSDRSDSSNKSSSFERNFERSNSSMNSGRSGYENRSRNSTRSNYSDRSYSDRNTFSDRTGYKSNGNGSFDRYDTSNRYSHPNRHDNKDGYSDGSTTSRRDGYSDRYDNSARSGYSDRYNNPGRNGYEDRNGYSSRSSNNDRNDYPNRNGHYDREGFSNREYSNRDNYSNKNNQSDQNGYSSGANYSDRNSYASRNGYSNQNNYSDRNVYSVKSANSYSPQSGTIRRSLDNNGSQNTPSRYNNEQQNNRRNYGGTRRPRNLNMFNGSKKSRSRNAKNSDEIQAKRPTIAFPKIISLATLASYLKLRLAPLKKKMDEMGFEKNIHHDTLIDGETAVLIADDLGFDAVVNEEEGADLVPARMPEDKSNIPLRPPIVTIMGHVDHGKTTILDYLRKSSVAAGEHGGITQHIGAFSVVLPSIKDETRNRICFLDTPGHAAFLNMRQRGANVTDIVVLVVAADDSVMPQTKEAIKHAKNAHVPMIVAINKIDKPDANLEKVTQDLLANEIDVESYGGDTQVIPVSGKTGQGIDKLEEAILTLSEMLDIRSPVEGAPEGWVLESRMKKGLGQVATVLVRRGTLQPGNIIVAGTKWCKVKIIRDDQGKTIKMATPGMPVEVLGWKELPEAGEEILGAESEDFAKQVIENRARREEQINDSDTIVKINEQRKLMRQAQEREKLKEERAQRGLPTDDETMNELLGVSSKETGPTKLNFIVKADVSGSAEAVEESIQGLGNDQIQANVIYSEAGPPTENDLTYAETTGAIIITFNVKLPKDIASQASRSKVELMEHTIIYKLLEDVTAKLESQLEPDIQQKVLAEASIREIFNISVKRAKDLKVAGCKVTKGPLKRSAQIRVLRDGKTIFTGKLAAMKHLKDDVDEIRKDADCGLRFDGWDKFEQDDVVQAYEEIVIPRYL